MFAIVDFNGNQFKFEEGKELNLPLFECKVGEKIVLDKVLMLSEDKSVKLNEDASGSKVEVEVLSFGQTPKVGVVKFHSKKRYKKMGNHRQDFVKVRVTKIIVK